MWYNRLKFVLFYASWFLTLFFSSFKFNDIIIKNQQNCKKIYKVKEMVRDRNDREERSECENGSSFFHPTIQQRFALMKLLNSENSKLKQTNNVHNCNSWFEIINFIGKKTAKSALFIFNWAEKNEKLKLQLLILWLNRVEVSISNSNVSKVWPIFFFSLLLS